MEKTGISSQYTTDGCKAARQTPPGPRRRRVHVRQESPMPTTQTPKPTPFDQFAAVNQRAMANAARANARMMRDMLKLQSHLLAFTARRIQRDIETAEKFAVCEDAPEMVTLAQSFYAEAMSDYAEEAAEFLRLSAKVANGQGEAVAAMKAAQ
jgi:hypothetical protein